MREETPTLRDTFNFPSMRGADTIAENVFFAIHQAAERRDMEEKVDVWGEFQTSSLTFIALRGQLLVTRKPSFPKSS